MKGKLAKLIRISICVHLFNSHWRRFVKTSAQLQMHISLLPWWSAQEPTRINPNNAKIAWLNQYITNHKNEMEEADMTQKSDNWKKNPLQQSKRQGFKKKFLIELKMTCGVRGHHSSTFKSEQEGKHGAKILAHLLFAAASTMVHYLPLRFEVIRKVQQQISRNRIRISATL